ncbi:Vacuolar H+transporting two-sector ATPase F subunit [Methanocaldococcus vulcanius M7]|uniref:A-type ATP synthase subunit F n=1 Tax=Methanocaldococcus vulcanius (strain ATCC 700851 / DSM 12094 / M7) TaxID=579137 RepID=C9RDT3_METVM|nr:V-type ATP synthase subunit F [Methanocaldococcus vulcanius]ACX73462.1 Vacuolar H+transporting two-sector ATPase F subunit [Methanocaldococcus vulcanius M7]
MKIGVIGDRETAIGFRLAGLTDVYEVKNEEEAVKAVNELANNENIAFIIITERIAESIKDNLKNINKVLVEIPDKKGKLERIDPVKELIRKAIGVTMK